MKLTKDMKKVLRQVNSGDMYATNLKFKTAIKKLILAGYLKIGLHDFLQFTETTKEVLDQVYRDEQ